MDSQPSALQEYGNGSIAYRYSPLISEAGQETIRLIKLLPGRGSATISCELIHAPLSNSPAYDALSYCWGDATVTVPILCNGSKLSITQSLHSALWRLRERAALGEPSLLWADAICINQLDINERNQQVRLMRQIYEKARHVLIWLGAGDEDSGIAFALIAYLLDLIQKSTPFEEVKIPIAYWEALFSFMRRPWFSRVWVIQEVAFSQDATFLCGGNEISWHHLNVIGIYSSRLGATALVQWAEIDQMLNITFAKDKIRSGEDPGLLTLLQRHRRGLATDPRDKVFALCGLSKESGSAGIGIIIDYNLSVEQIYKSLAVSILKRDQNLDILSAADSHSESPNPALPSWVPDWSQWNTPSRIDWLGEATETFLDFQATGKSVCTPRFIGDRILELDGYVVDYIVETGELFDKLSQFNQRDERSDTEIADRLFALVDLFKEWQGIATSRQEDRAEYINGENMVSVYMLLRQQVVGIVFLVKAD